MHKLGVADNAAGFLHISGIKGCVRMCEVETRSIHV